MAKFKVVLERIDIIAKQAEIVNQTGTLQHSIADPLQALLEGHLSGSQNCAALGYLLKQLKAHHGRTCFRLLACRHSR